ncbi:hypothetical protein [Cetobacterium somerae]
MFLEYIINIKSLFILSVLLCLGLSIFKNKIYFFGTTGLIIFLWIPYIVDQIFIGRIVTNIDDSKVWFGFLSGYLGSGFGAIATLVGIFYQLNYTKKMEEKNRIQGILLYLKYSLENISKSEVLLFDVEENSFINEDPKSFFQISEEFLRENIKLLFLLGQIRAKELLDFFMEVFLFNSTCLKLSKIKENKYIFNDILNLLEKYKYTGIEKEIYENVLKTKDFFKILDSLITYRFLLKNTNDDSIAKNAVYNYINLATEDLLKKKEDIGNANYIKNRKHTKEFLLLNISIVRCEELKNNILDEKIEDEKIFYTINTMKHQMLMYIITIEEEEKLDSELFTSIITVLRSLKNRTTLESTIIRDKKSLQLQAIDLIIKLNSFK